MNTTIKKLSLLGFLFFIELYKLNGQNVAINTSGTAAYQGAILDLSNGNLATGTVGFLPPWVTLTSLSTLSPVVGTAANLKGLLVYNTGGTFTAGLYYWTGAAWVSTSGGGTITGANNGLSVSGTLIQLGGTLIQNTTITQAGYNLSISGGNLNLNTSGSSPTIIGFGGTGAVYIGNSTGNVSLFYAPFTTSNSIVYTTGATGALTALAPSATANYVLTTTTAGGAPSWQPASGGGITGSGTPDYLARWTPTGTNLGIGVTQDNGATVGISTAPVGTQMLTVTQTTAANMAILGQNTASSGTNTGVGVEGISSQAYSSGVTNGYGMVALNNNANGTGLYAAGNNLGANYDFLTAGSGASLVGTNVGVFGYAAASGGYGLYGISAGSTSTACGVFGLGRGSISTGVIGLSNNIGAYYTLVDGSGGAFNGEYIGLLAYETVSVLGGAAAVCDNITTGNQVFVNYYNGTSYKIYGTAPGTVSCSVSDTKGNYVVMHAPETPECYYEDYGEGKLVNGKAHIDLDPIYSKNVCVNDKHPLRVFIQLEGDCKGVYVTNKTTTGFDVVELDGGTSNTNFQYHIIANVADAILPSGITSKFADLRFEPTQFIPVDKNVTGQKDILNNSKK